MGSIRLLALVLLGLSSHIALAYPDYFLQTYATLKCLDHPNKSFGNHGAPRGQDRETSILLSPAFSGSLPPKGRLCPGAHYNVEVTFPNPRLALLTASSGTLAGSEAQCPNRIITPDQRPVTTWRTNLKVPCNTAGKKLQIKVTSAQSSIGQYRFATVTLNVASTEGTCSHISSRCGMGGGGDDSVVPVTSFDPNNPGARVVELEENFGAARLLPPPVYSLRPVLKSNKYMWQLLHSVLMLASFGVLMPLGVLLARHRWMFGRDTVTGKVVSSWFWVHLITQLLALLTAFAGIVIAILAFGWKSVPGLKLYLPHKWMGVVVIAMSLVQVLLAPLRPAVTSPRRAIWNLLHWSWGRLIILGGAANTILGALLLHDYKGAPYLNWLLPCCVVVGCMGLLVLVLEAFKLQMQRTHRYHHRTGVMLPVFDGFKHSRRRTGPQWQTAPEHGSETSYEAGASSSDYPALQYDASTADTLAAHDQSLVDGGRSSCPT